VTPAVLIVHNAYRHRGGEEKAVDLLARALSARGHRVETLIEDSRNWAARGLAAKIGAALSTPYSQSVKNRLRNRIAVFRPDIISVHNIFPFLTPSVYAAAVDAGVPVVQTLHNYRWFCMNGLMFRDGAPCELCLDRASPAPGITHACYQDSRSKSVMMAATLSLHRSMGTWESKVAAYIALSEFSRNKYVAAGFPKEKIHVVRNGVPVPAGAPSSSDRSGFFYLGRLSEEKGVRVLLEADRRYREHGGRSPLVIAGDGPLSADVERYRDTQVTGAVVVEGRVDEARKAALFVRARFLVFPSICYENGPYAVLESLAAGVPVIAARTGGVPELLKEKETGRLVAPRDPEALAAAMRESDADNASWAAWSEKCRQSAANGLSEDRWINATLQVFGSVLGGERRPAAGAI
jgi:glycosyltransferase involved in cell wall biosynthesis